MKLKGILASIIIFQSICCWLSPAIAVAQSLTPRSATAISYIERGGAWLAKGELERAIADFDLAIATDPNLAYGYNSRGAARWRLKDYERAVADFNRAIQLDPRFAEAYVNRGKARYLMGDLDGAISDGSRCIELDPKRANGWYIRGMARGDKKIMKARSLISTAPSNSTRAKPKSTAIAAWRGSIWAIRMARSAITPARSNSIPIFFKPGSSAARRGG